ncbi:MAG TPA: hypothetical protein VKH44_00130 [Pirellulaceae bacterium]|nr:hypothetical protein [Pirellulaceae bacterium]
MRLFSILVAAVIVVGLAPAARSQGQQQPQVATTVQLPTFSVFNVTTTVSVPDSGGAYLGGINRGVDSTVTRGVGPLRNRGTAGSRTASGMSISATIIDHEEIDRAILAEAASKHRTLMDPASTKAAVLSKSVGRSDSRVAEGGAAALPDSLAAIRERNSAAADLQAAELAGYLAKARQAESEGKPGVAKIFYQMVARRDAGQLKQQAVERLVALDAVTAKR